MIRQTDLVLPPVKRGFHLISQPVIQALGKLPNEGILHIFLQHTSAGLMINENADPSVRADLESAFNKMVPENMPWYTHIFEGEDDMPAHIKSALCGVSLSIPIRAGKLALGTWQGIYLCEFRNRGGSRRLLLTVCS